MKKKEQEVFDFGSTVYLAGGNAIIELTDSKEMVGDPSTQTESITPVNKKTIQVKFVKRGTSNKQPVEVMDKIYANSTLGANIAFNAKMGYGDGIMVVKKVRQEDGSIKAIEQLPSDQPDIFKFLIDNNYINSVQEWAMDLVTFYESYAEFIFGIGTDKIVQLNPVESVNSRLSEANDKGDIEYHGYSLKWHEGTPDDVNVTALLNRRRPLMDLKIRRGIELNLKGKKQKDSWNSYILQLMQPTPGRYYHGKPYWWAIFESGWYDFAVAIPKFKKALLKNQMTLKYHVKINREFWTKLFTQEGIDIANKEQVKARKKKFFNQMNDFLASEENAGASFVSHFEYDRVKNYEVHDIIISVIEASKTGGEYLEDSSEVTNVICYAMEIQPSLIGANSKNGSINGTEARELFIIKQAMMKPIRDLLVLPLYIVKEINKWDPDVHFVIPNIMLTTLDKNTGAEKSIGNQKI